MEINFYAFAADCIEGIHFYSGIHDGARDLSVEPAEVLAIETFRLSFAAHTGFGNGRTALDRRLMSDPFSDL
jgi:hypothetical protein